MRITKAMRTICLKALQEEDLPVDLQGCVTAGLLEIATHGWVLTKEGLEAALAITGPGRTASSAPKCVRCQAQNDVGVRACWRCGKFVQ